jgi:hypothetical protein
MIGVIKLLQICSKVLEMKQTSQFKIEQTKIVPSTDRTLGSLEESPLSIKKFSQVQKRKIQDCQRSHEKKNIQFKRF